MRHNTVCRAADYAVGNRHIHTATAKHTADTPAPIHQRSGKPYNSHAHEQPIITQAMILPFSGIARLRSQFSTIGPK